MEKSQSMDRMSAGGLEELEDERAPCAQSLKIITEILDLTQMDQ